MKDHTPSLFGTQDAYGGFAPSIPPRGRSVPALARKRLSDQCAAILERLRQGPATNDELAAISRKYTSRISDLRKAGYVIECFEQDHATGLTWYRLVSEPNEKDSVA